MFNRRFRHHAVTQIDDMLRTEGCQYFFQRSFHLIATAHQDLGIKIALQRLDAL